MKYNRLILFGSTAEKSKAMLDMLGLLATFDVLPFSWQEIQRNKGPFGWDVAIIKRDSDEKV